MDAEFNIVPWHDFYIMLGGAAAVLAGLQLVVLILRVERMGTGWLRTGARAYFTFLAMVLVVSALLLMPDQPRSVLAAEVSICGLIVTVVYGIEVREIVSDAEGLPTRLIRWGPSRFAATLGLTWGGLSVGIGHGGGWYVVAPSLIALVVINLQGVWWGLSGHRPAPHSEVSP